MGHQRICWVRRKARRVRKTTARDTAAGIRASQRMVGNRTLPNPHFGIDLLFKLLALAFWQGCEEAAVMDIQKDKRDDEGWD